MNVPNEDRNAVEFLAKYVCFGLHPGAFGEALITKNIEYAYGAGSNRYDRQDHSGSALYVERMLIFAEENLPQQCYFPGDRVGSSNRIWSWIKHCGLTELDNQTKMMIRLETKDFWYIDYLPGYMKGLFSWNAS